VDGSVAITGVSGYIGTRLVELAEEEAPGVPILGLDIQEPEIDAENLTFVERDVRADDLADLFEEHDVEALVHLAFILDPIHDLEEMRSVNLEGTRNVLDAAAEAGLAHVTVASSSTAYGAFPDNPDYLTEEDPLRAHEHDPPFHYSKHKVEQEWICDEFEEGNPDATVTRIRPTIVMGAHIDNFISRFAERGTLVGFRGTDPPMQFVHEEDIARIFWKAVEEREPGAFNAVSKETMNLSEMAEASGGRFLRLPAKVAFGLNSLAWKLRLPVAEAPPGNLHYSRYRWTADNSRATEVLGWEPETSSREAYQEMVEAKGLTD
jgi:UDP-glucose 4-epimerase